MLIINKLFEQFHLARNSIPSVNGSAAKINSSVKKKSSIISPPPPHRYIVLKSYILVSIMNKQSKYFDKLQIGVKENIQRERGASLASFVSSANGILSSVVVRDCRYC